MGFLGDLVMTPLYYVVSACLLAWREIWESPIPDDAGWQWALAIVGMTVTIRVLMVPLYVRQVGVRREMRQLEPRFRDLLVEYGHDRARLMQEQRKLWKATGANPLLSSLPLVLLGLVLFALFRIVDAAASYTPSDGAFERGLITESQAQSLAGADVLGAKIADTVLDGSSSESTVVGLALIVVMCVTQVIAQRQQRAELPPALSEQVANQQRFFVFALPALLAAIGLVLPLGVLIFWTTSKVWTVGQNRLLRDDPGPATA